MTNCHWIGRSFVSLGLVELPGGFEERDAAVDGGMEHRDHLPPIGSAAVPAGHAHSTEADGRDFQTASAEDALVHSRSPSEW